MIAFNLLSEPIRKYIRDKGWESLRPIQEAAIQRILSTENNYVLISRTASGKTEAAFLPILSRANFKKEGVRILYISPLVKNYHQSRIKTNEQYDLHKNLYL